MAELDREALIASMLRQDVTIESFSLLYSRILELDFNVTALRYDPPGTISFTKADGTSHTLYLDNLWIEYRACIEDGRETIQRYLAAVDSIDDQPASRERVVALVKDQVYVELLGVDHTIPVQHLVGDIWIVYAVDRFTTIRTLSRKEMLSLKLCDADLLELAIANLKNIVPQPECHGDGPWFLLTAGGDYVASLLLLESVWEFAATLVEGDVVAAAPARDVVLFTGSKSREGLAAIRAKAIYLVASSDHVVSSTLIKRDEAGWKVFD